MRLTISLLFALLLQQASAQFMMPMTGTAYDFEAEPKMAWKFSAGGPIVGSPVIANEIVYVGSLDSVLYAIDLATGKERWKFRTGGPVRNSVAIIGNLLFLLSSDGLLYRLSADSGKVNGFYQTMTGYAGDHQNDMWDYFTSTPVIVDSTIYFGSGQDVYAIDVNDGYLKWVYKTDGLVHTKPAVSRNKLYVGSFDGYLYAINLFTGTAEWKFKTTGKFSFPKGEVTGSPALGSGVVIAGSRDYNVYAVDVRGGFCNWTKQFPYGWALPVTVNDSVAYVGTSDDRTLYALDVLSGREIWKASAGFNIFGGCAIAKNVGYFGTLAGKLMGVDLRKGKILWSIETDAYKSKRLSWFDEEDNFRKDIGQLIKTPVDMLRMYQELGGIFGTPAVSTDRIVTAGYDGSVYCFTPAGK